MDSGTEMTSSYDRVVSALQKLEQHRQNCRSISASETFCPLERTIVEFQDELRFLKVFLDCIQKWSDADKVVRHLGALSIKIEATFEEIRDQLIENLNLWMERDPPTLIEQLFPPIWRKNDSDHLHEWIHKLIYLFNSLREKIRLLKREMRKVHDNFLRMSSLEIHSPRHDFGGWKKFVQSVLTNLLALGQKACHDVSDKWDSFHDHLTRITDFLSNLKDDSLRNPKIEDVMMHVGSVTFRAALLSSQCWARYMYPDSRDFWCWDCHMSPKTKALMTNRLSDLQQKITLTDPEFVAMNLKLLKSCQANTDGTIHEVKAFVNHLLPSGKHHISVWNLLFKHLITLITSVLNIPEENMQRFFADLKVLVMEVASSTVSLKTPKTSRKLEIIVVLNHHVKIWLIKREVFLREQLITGDILQLSREQQIHALNKELHYSDFEKWLTNTIKNSANCNTRDVKRVLTLMKEVSKVVASLDNSIQPKEKTRKRVRSVLIKLLLMIVLFREDSSIMKLRDEYGSLTAFGLDRIESLNEGLKFLMKFVMSEDSIDDGKPIFAHVEALASGVISLCYSFPTRNITEELAKNVNSFLSDLLNENNRIMLELKEIYLHVPRSNFPKTNGLGFIDSLLINLKELLNHKADLIAPMKHQMEEILMDLQFLRSFFPDIQGQEVEVQELKDLKSHLVEVAYKAEYYIDSIMVGTTADWQNSMWLYNLLEDIRLLKMQVSKDDERKTNDARVHNVRHTLRHIKPWDSSPRLAETVVGLSDQEEEIVDQLTGGVMQQDIVSIVGMPGIGKTTLAKKVYNSPKVVYHFHIRTWCRISEVYRKRDLLLEILSQLPTPTEIILRMTDEDLEFKLYKLLKNKRYLIVMDDMWNSGAWEDLRRSFPNDKNGSRILITSRLLDVAVKIKAHTDPHSLRLLSEAESWKLLHMKIFNEERCPEELMEIGKQIARSCKGLPLALVSIAGLLKSMDRQQIRWKEIAESLSLPNVNNPLKQCLDILELSYKHLPDYLKVCFLYFGAFPEDEEIAIQKLIRLWIAEGFIMKDDELKSLEDIAEDYLMDLMGRSLVIFAQPRSDGGVKRCRVHDMLRTLCLSKAKDESFLLQITRSDEPSFGSLDYGVDFNHFNPSNDLKYKDYRLCIYSKRKHFVMSRSAGPLVRSLLFFATSDMYPRCPYDISFISDNFKLLKVLDLEDINMGTSFPSGIELLIHLRYLAASGDIDSVPSSIANLWNLETLLVKGLKGKVKLPDTIWHMARLRHLHVSSRAFFNLQDVSLGCSPRLDNLVTLSLPIFFHGESTTNMLKRFPNLRKLGCIFSECLDNSQNENLFPGLRVLTRLESLKISYSGSTLHPGEFSFPLNLKKFTLSNFSLQQAHISAIGRLQGLEILKLRSVSLEGLRWDMVEGEFSTLQFLKLESLNIAEWTACDDPLPNLQQLVLRCCKKLKEVPDSFGEIPTLKMIEVQWCRDSTVESVRRIEGEGDGALKVIITSLSDSDFRS